MLSQLEAMTRTTAAVSAADPVGRPVAATATATATAEARARAPSAWQAAAVAAFALEAGVGSSNLRAELAARLLGLTGCAVSDGAITGDRDARRATATLDGVVFQLWQHDLLLLRPCAYCGTGLFASLPLSSRADLGHALSGWQPYHTECEPVDSAADAAW